MRKKYNNKNMFVIEFPNTLYLYAVIIFTVTIRDSIKIEEQKTNERIFDKL